MSYNTNADRDDAPSSSGAPLIPLVGASGCSVVPVCFRSKSTVMTFDLMERFGGLKDSKTGDRQAIATALGKLLRRALEAFLREEVASRR